jgi:hypothetical protein
MPRSRQSGGPPCSRPNGQPPKPKFDAVASAREAAVAAETARVVAAEAARKAALDLEPVSVFISRKTQRLYVRQAFQPILESPVTIRDPHRPIGTHVFTAIERTGSDVDMRWSVVSLNVGHADTGVAEPHRPRRGRSGRDGEPISTDPVGAKAALERIAIPQDALDRIAGIASPRSSLIISDEALSSETGKGTEFVVLMSGEPQGGIKFRRRSFETEVRYECAADGPNREMARVPDAAHSTRSSTGWSLPPGSKSAMMCRQDSRLAQGAALDLRPPVKQQDGLACDRFAASGYSPLVLGRLVVRPLASAATRPPPLFLK